jgi:hypothetical protein
LLLFSQEASERNVILGRAEEFSVMKRQEHHFGLTPIIFVLLFYILTLLACAPAKVRVYPREPPPEKIGPPKTASERTAQEKTGPVKAPPGAPSSERPSAGKIPTAGPPLQKPYDETVSEWKSEEDLVRWMENDFSFDRERYEKFKGTLPVPRTPEETFQLKAGIYIDAAMFSKEVLNRIDPSYQEAQIVILIMRRYGFNHYACSFRKDGKLFIMDYGTPYKEVTGLHGPYGSLEEYEKFYEKHRPMKGEIEAITYLP